MLNIESAPWRELYPFPSHFLQLPGGRCHYVDESADSAAAPTLLFVHGNPTWSFHWRQFVLALRGKYRCVAPDHLGCGGSDLQATPLRLADHIDNLVRLVEILQLRRITLVAQDWGGAIGLGAAERLPERMERIVLFNTGAFPPWYIPWRIRSCRWPLWGKLAVQGANGFSRAALRMTLARRGRLERLVEQAYLAPYATWHERAAVYQFVQDIPLGPSHPTWQTLQDLEAGLPQFGHLPIQLIWGLRDWCFRPECLEKFASIWPNAEVQRLEDVGHWVVEDAPAESLALLSDWLERTAENSSRVSET